MRVLFTRSSPLHPAAAGPRPQRATAAALGSRAWPGRHRAVCRSRHCAAAAAAEAAAPAQAFEELLGEALSTHGGAASSAVRLAPAAHGNGLFLTRDVVPGDVVLSVPTPACLVVDFERGLQLPQAEWPRLRRALAKDDALPWDVLQALALLDSLAGAGGRFWERYAHALLPGPTALALPCCLPDPPLLEELQHGAIVAGARAQKERLRGLFPGLSAAMCEGGPTWLEWAFGCVRSRAFRLGPESFAFVPFLDAANHAAEPSCDFRLAPDGSRVELVAVQEARAGEEATISYTGPQGMTSQRLMAQYGFVPAGGNPHDRLAFAVAPAAVAEGVSAAPSPAAGPAAGPGQGGAGGPVLLSLDRMQGCLGDGQSMVAAFSGKSPFFYAALKSLPLAADEADAASWERQAELARALLAEVEAERQGWPTTVEQDRALLEGPAEGASSANCSTGLDGRLAAAVQYRMQRKLLVLAAGSLLQRFLAS